MKLVHELMLFIYLFLDRDEFPGMHQSSDRASVSLQNLLQLNFRQEIDLVKTVYCVSFDDLRETRQDKMILLSGLRPITTGVNIQAIRILMDPMTDLNSVF